MKKTFLLLISLLSLNWLMAQSARSTGFRPEIHGFKFVNNFKNALPFDIRTGGLCGGMVYSALDYYYARMPIPQQLYRPAERTPLQSYIYNRQLNSLSPNLDKWAEVGFNPNGARNSEFFEWGLKGFGGGRLQELKELIDRGQPAVLGMQGAGGARDGGGHQILAIGYKMGRYRGDLGNFKEELEIYVYDPNFPGQTKVLVPDLAKQIYHYKSGEAKEWRTYFVDKKYVRKTPISIPNRTYPNDGKIHELVLEFGTGGDDLRGGNDNFSLAINAFEGPAQIVANVNRSANWMRDYNQFVCVPLNRPVTENELKSIDLNFTTGGAFPDNWDLKCLNVYVPDGNRLKRIYSTESSVGSFFQRFTSSLRKATAVINRTPPVVHDDKIRAIDMTFYTGSDDLRGGNDNVNVDIYYTDGTRQTVRNINSGARWKDNSSQMVSIQLDKAVPRSGIRSIVLSTTFGGGMGGDNWNMNKLEIRGNVGSVNQVLYTRGGNPLKRFTGSDKTFSFTL